MEQHNAEVPIGQRLKFLMQELGYDVRGFSKALDVGDTTIRNYFNRGSNPNADFLAKLTSTFERVNLHWLLTGNGTHLLPPMNENDPVTTTNQKIFRSPIIGNNQGTANQQQNITSVEHEAMINKLALAEKEIEHLRTQLTMQAALLASKDETITLLRASYNRPN